MPVAPAAALARQSGAAPAARPPAAAAPPAVAPALPLAAGDLPMAAAARAAPLAATGDFPSLEYRHR